MLIVSVNRCNTVDMKHTVDSAGMTNAAEIPERTAKFDFVPKDILTREHFGLAKCKDLDEEVNLLGLYQGLFSTLAVSFGEAHEWQNANKIPDNVLEKYSGWESKYLE